jgi:hypothetical protein
MSELPKWPDEPEEIWADNCFPHHVQEIIRHERARADAAIARLRLAVEALNKLEVMGWAASFNEKRVVWREALAQIGPIPE